MTNTLTREQRMEALGIADEAALVDLADRVLDSVEVEVLRGPSVGLLMVRAEEPSDRLPFNLAEVTVSEAEVSAEGDRGYAMVMGRCPEKALAGAILDVAVERGHPLSAEIESLLQHAVATEEERVRRELQRVAPTRVRFEEILQ